MNARLAICNLVFLVVFICHVHGQNIGRYRSPFTTRRSNINDGRYNSGNDGRYNPNNDGRYRGGGQDGRYVHQDVKYQHDDRPDAGYKGDNNPYIHIQGQNGPGAPSAVSSRIGGGNIKPSGNLFGTGESRPLTKGKGTGEGKNGWKILQLHDKVDKDGYHYLYETENGILAEEEGHIEKLQPDADGLRSKGFYEYTGDDGNLYRVDYVADDKGFVPVGDHIPREPPFVAKLLAYLEANGKN